MDSRPQRLYEFGPFQLDREAQLLTRDGATVTLSPRMFDLLSVLVENVGRMISKEDLMKAVWKECSVEEGNLTVSIFKLRRVLGRGNNNRPYIETIPRRGYRFAADNREGNQNGNHDVIDAARHSGRYDKKSGIAVLPFRFIGPVGEEFIGLGIADALITKLSSLTNIAVRPTSSISRFNGTQDPVVAGRELNVESVLDGSIQKRGRRVRVTTQLVSVGDGSILWAGKFDEKFSDIFAMEDSISEQLANALNPELTRKERRLLTKRYTESAEAHEAYLKGRYFFAKRAKDGFERGIECFNRAISIDPNYALAHSGLADCSGLLVSHGALFPSEGNVRTEQAALRAIELEPELAEAHASLGHLRLRQWNWREAENRFKHAIELNPNYAISHNWYATCLLFMGRTQEALLENERALELDPLSLGFRSTRGKLFYFAREYDKAIDLLSSVLELNSQYGLASYYLGLAYDSMERFDDALMAIRHAMRFLEEVPEFIAAMGRIQALKGCKLKARKAISELTDLSNERHVQPYFIALIYAGLGDKGKAFSWLEKGFAARDEDLILLGVDPRMDGLRSDRRFVDLLQRIGFPNATNRRTLEAAPDGRPD